MKKTIFPKELRSFLLLWSSQAVSGLGTAMTDYALILWTYAQTENAAGVTTLTLCSFLPTILFRFAAGAMADRWNKKRIMLFSDTLAACATLTVLGLYSACALRTWQVYLINFLLSWMNAFQAPASFAATSLLVPREHYAAAGGLQGFSGSVTAILAPVLGGVLLRIGGLKLVLVCDLASFMIALLTLVFFVHLPRVEKRAEQGEESFAASCMQGIRYLRSDPALLRITLFFAAVNFLAKLGNDGMLAPFVLAKTGNDQTALGLVQSACAFGALTGSIIAAGMKPFRRRTKMIFLLTALIFAGNIAQSLTASVFLWVLAAFVTYVFAVIMNVNLTALLRERIPVELHGRVFSARDTLQNGTIPLALFLGGRLADNVLEPFMAMESPMQRMASALFGTGSGAGIAVMFFCAGILGIGISLFSLMQPVYSALDQPSSEEL